MKHRKGPTRALEALVVEEQKEVVARTGTRVELRKCRCSDKSCRAERVAAISVRDGVAPKVVECWACERMTAEIV